MGGGAPTGPQSRSPVECPTLWAGSVSRGSFSWGHVIRNPECNLGAAAASAASAPCSSGALPDGRARKGRSLRCDARGAAHRGRGGARRARAGDHVSAAQGARWAKPPMVGACAVALLLPTAARCVRRMARCAGATRRADDWCCTCAGRAGLSMRASAPGSLFCAPPLGRGATKDPTRATDGRFYFAPVAWASLAAADARDGCAERPFVPCPSAAD